MKYLLFILFVISPSISSAGQGMIPPGHMVTFGAAPSGVARIGSISSVDVSAVSGTTSVTVPSGTDLAVLIISGYHATTYAYMNDATFTLNSTAKTVLAHTEPSDAYDHVIMAYWVSPSAGSQTFAWDWSIDTNPDAGGRAVIVYYDHVNTSAPISGSPGSSVVNNGTISGLTAGTGDMMIGAAVSDSALTITGGGKTSIYNDVTNSIYLGIAELAEATSFGYSGGTGATSVAAVINAE